MNGKKVLRAAVRRSKPLPDQPFHARNPWSPQAGEWGRFSRLHFRNISAEEPFLFPSRLPGYDETHPIEDTVFENVRVGGKWMRSAEDMNIVTKKFVRNVRFMARHRHEKKQDRPPAVC